METIQFAGFKVAKNYAHPANGYFIAYNDEHLCLFGDDENHIIDNIIRHHGNPAKPLSGTYRGMNITQGTEPWMKRWVVSDDDTIHGSFDTFERAMCGIDTIIKSSKSTT